MQFKCTAASIGVRADFSYREGAEPSLPEKIFPQRLKISQSWGLRPRSYDKTGLRPASVL